MTCTKVHLSKADIGFLRNQPKSALTALSSGTRRAFSFIFRVIRSAQTLLGEYRRDIGRFLRREAENYPAMPKNYFDRDAVETLVAFEREALSDRQPDLFASFPADRLARDLRNTWHSAAKQIYRNWILYLSALKNRRSKLLAVNDLV
jgi:homoserine trans-succinylase